jgi:hypothetical protein
MPEPQCINHCIIDFLRLLINAKLTRNNCWRQGIAVREKTLRWRISPRYCRRGGQGVAERQNPLRRGMSLGYSERSRKNRSIRGFRCLSVTFVMFVHFLVYVVTPQDLCPAPNRSLWLRYASQTWSWGKYVITKLLWQKVKALAVSDCDLTQSPVAN